MVAVPRCIGGSGPGCLGEFPESNRVVSDRNSAVTAVPAAEPAGIRCIGRLNPVVIIGQRFGGCVVVCQRGCSRQQGGGAGIGGRIPPDLVTGGAEHGGPLHGNHVCVRTVRCGNACRKIEPHPFIRAEVDALSLGTRNAVDIFVRCAVGRADIDAGTAVLQAQIASAEVGKERVLLDVARAQGSSPSSVHVTVRHRCDARRGFVNSPAAGGSVVGIP